jgi:ssRNA-specific RNase YbeY (16S rRNA maturation enzyme)
MTVILDIFSESGYKFDHSRVRSVIKKLLASQGITSDVELAVVMVGERKMRKLHQKYLQSDEVTDVLSFPVEEGVFPDGVLRLGDIEEIEMLVEHGCGHLLGVHHEL